MSDQQPKPATVVAGQFPFSQQLPHIVLNTFALSCSASEMTVIVAFAERPLAQLILPFSVAKSFAKGISEALKNYEQTTKTEVLSIEEIVARTES